MNRILLITDMAPTSEFTAGIILEQFVRKLSGFQVDLSVLVDRNLPNYHVSRSATLGQINWFPKPNENWVSVPKLFANVGEWLSIRESLSISKIVLKSISRHAPDHLIFVIQGQSSIRVAAELAKTGIPYTCIHWDPWSWWAKFNFVPEKFENEINKAYRELTSVGLHIVPTSNFGKVMGTNELDTYVLYPFVAELNSSSAINLETLRFVFVGQPYAQSEINQLLKVLDESHWEFEGCKIELHTYGSKTIGRSSPNIIEHGYVDYQLLPELINDFDIAILPYPGNLDIPDAHLMSFPSKLATYVTAGLPVLYIGPEKSSVSNIVERCGTALSSRFNSEDFHRAVNFLIDNQVNIHQNILWTYNEFFSEQRQSRLVAGWIKAAGLAPNFTNISFKPKKMKIREHARGDSETKFFSILLKRFFSATPKRIVFLSYLILRGIARRIIKVVIS